MSQFLVKPEQDPTHLFLRPVTRIAAERKIEDCDVTVSQQLKPKFGFDLVTLAEKGQISLLQISDKYGAMFFAFGSELIVVPNAKLNQVLNKNNLADVHKESNKTHGSPIIFLHVCDKINKFFMQHQGDDFLIVADLPTVITDTKTALSVAKRISMNLDSVDVRQISITPGADKLATVVTRNDSNKHRLILVNYETGAIVSSQEDINSAVFSADGKSIVAGKDSTEQNIVVFDLNLNEVNQIKFSFPDLSEDIEVDMYRIFWICEPFKNNYILFAAYYASEDDKEENIGKTLMIWIGTEIACPGLTLETLKAKNKIKACFWDYDHMNDDLIPSYNIEWFDNPASPETIGIAMQNHSDCPYFICLSDGDLKECYELTSKNTFINRPIDENDEPMECSDTMGACLGFEMLRTKMAGVDEIWSQTLIDDEGEEDLPYPQTLIFYSLDGKLKQYQIFTRQWRTVELTLAPQPVPVGALISSVSQQTLPKPAQKPALVPKTEEKKLPPLVQAQQQPQKPGLVQVNQPQAKPGLVMPQQHPPSSMKFGGSLLDKIKASTAQPSGNSAPAINSVFSANSSLQNQIKKDGPKTTFMDAPSSNSPFQSAPSPFGSMSAVKPNNTQQSSTGAQPSTSPMQNAFGGSSSSGQANQPFGGPLSTSVSSSVLGTAKAPMNAFVSAKPSALAQQSQPQSQQSTTPISQKSSTGLFSSNQQPQESINQQLLQKPLQPLLQPAMSFGTGTGPFTQPVQKQTNQPPSTTIKNKQLFEQGIQQTNLNQPSQMLQSQQMQQQKPPGQQSLYQSQSLKQPQAPQNMMQSAPQQNMQKISQNLPQYSVGSKPAALQQQQQPPRPHIQSSQPQVMKTREQIEAELFSKFSPEMKLALEHDNLFADELYNPMVTQSMNQMAAMFPSKEKLMQEMQMRGNLAEMLSQSDSQAQKEKIKECLQSTQRFQLAMFSQQQLCERLKREARYGIIGGPGVSAANPSSDLMKLNKTYREFINGSSYNDEDKEILMEVFESGNKAIEAFDRIVAQQNMQETLKGLYFEQLKKKGLSAEEQDKMHSGQSGPFGGLSNSAPKPAQDVNSRLRENLLRNAGIVRLETDKKRVSAQIYAQESTSFIKKQLAEVENNFFKVQACLKANYQSTAQLQQTKEVAKTAKKLKLGDHDEIATSIDIQATSESEMKANVDASYSKDAYRKMIRDRKKQKHYQQKLLQQVKPKICLLEIRQPKITSSISANLPQSQAMKKLEQNTAQINKNQNEVKQDQQVLAKLFNNDDRKREKQEKEKFIAYLDHELITSPSQSPRPTQELSKYASQVNLTASEKPKQNVQDALKGLDGNARNSFAVKSFGSKNSDALQTQLSSRIHQQVSFGDDPKTMTSLQKNQLSELDQINENESPKKTSANIITAEKKQVSNKNGPNLFSVEQPKLTKQPGSKPAMPPKVDINISAPKKPDSSADGQQLQHQKTMNLADFKVPPSSSSVSKGKDSTADLGDKKAAPAGGLFDSLSIAKKPATTTLADTTKKPVAPKSSSAIDQSPIGSMPAKNLFGTPKLTGDEPKDLGKKPATPSLFMATASVSQTKPTSQFSALGGAPSSAAPGSKSAFSFGGALGGQGAKGSSTTPALSFGNLGQAAKSNQPTMFGQVDIGAKPQSKIEAPKSAFGAFGAASANSGASQTQAKPMTFSSGANTGAGGGFMKQQTPLNFGSSTGFGGAPGALSFSQGAQPGSGMQGGQQQPFGGGFQQQPAQQQQQQQQPLSFGNVQPQQPMSMGGAPQQQQQPMGGMFGASAPQGGQMQQPQAPQMFGGFGGQAPQQPQGGFQGFGGGGGSMVGGKKPVSQSMLKPRK